MKKRLVSLMLSLALVLTMVQALLPTASAAGNGTAYASTQTVEVDGKPVEFQMYALKDAKGNFTNYIKLRDMAYVLNTTPSSFDIGYNEELGYIQIWAARTSPTAR